MTARESNPVVPLYIVSCGCGLIGNLSPTTDGLRQLTSWQRVEPQCAQGQAVLHAKRQLCAIGSEEEGVTLVLVVRDSVEESAS